MNVQDKSTGTSDNAVLDTAKKITSDVANKASDIASATSDTAKKMTSDAANRASDIASAASEQAKTFASELERMGRANPLGAIAGALLVGVVIGLIGRGGRS
jgi:ElaB/YqjD/DUF883 family membrane-anchored ribosome-binding protein